MITIRCLTLYDITATGASARRAQATAQDRLRSQQQSNLDTVLQVISIRSQPELITAVRCQERRIHELDFGFAYPDLLLSPDTEHVRVWSFIFSVQHAAVFENTEGKLGALEQDCERVPMITDLEESVRLPASLTCDLDLRNIYFEIVDET